MPEGDAGSEESTAFKLNMRLFFMTLFEDLDPAGPEALDVTMNFSDNEKVSWLCLRLFELGVYPPPCATNVRADVD